MRLSGFMIAALFFGIPVFLFYKAGQKAMEFFPENVTPEEVYEEMMRAGNKYRFGSKG